MSKASGAFGAVGKVIIYVLVVLLVLGVAGCIAFFALRGQGVTFYVEYDNERYLANGDGGSLAFANGDTCSFAVKSLKGGEVNFDVKVMANGANNFTFSHNGQLYQFVSADEENNDYSDVFDLNKTSDGFSITIPKGFSVEQAVAEKYGGEIMLDEQLQNDKAYFVISVSAEGSSVNLWFLFDLDVVGITLNPPQIIF